MFDEGWVTVKATHFWSLGDKDVLCARLHPGVIVGEGRVFFEKDPFGLNHARRGMPPGQLELRPIPADQVARFGVEEYKIRAALLAHEHLVQLEELRLKMERNRQATGFPDAGLKVEATHIRSAYDGDHFACELFPQIILAAAGDVHDGDEWPRLCSPLPPGPQPTFTITADALERASDKYVEWHRKMVFHEGWRRSGLRGRRGWRLP
ncbi:hypothetical protein [Prescottella agglutinans]|uniref:Uncharacterized protein n=1 Tax=Prescottella agglutinans TaxID=1644129 RepID=A0ABT6MKJ5_9NOCA|nr:hypothetical protein [Prescottella agglutinans]MDH6284832.1 hypothetical protein [Prescottella agglutinans]